MPAFKVKVKWGKTTLEDVECITDEPPIVFKAQLFALTNVKPERQKIMLKGQTLKDEEWDKFTISNGSVLMMMGTADPDNNAMDASKPIEKPVFVEDMNEAERNKAMAIPGGLKNLGNTCYMNATVQCLRSVPELKTALLRYSGSILAEPVGTQAVTVGMRELLRSLDKSTGSAVTPFVFLQLMHATFPQFATKGEHGLFQQQDANEFWSELVSCLKQQLPGVEPSLGASPAGNGAAASAVGKFVEQYFRTEIKSSFKCLDPAAESEPPTTSVENSYQLSCFIDKDVKFLYTGLRALLEEKLTKRSITLERDAQYQKTGKFVRLPAYLSIQFVRFFYKEKESVNAKILKDVKFPLNLDLFELCSPEFQQRLMPMRERVKAEDDRKQEELKQIKLSEIDPQKKKDIKTQTFPYWFPDDIGSNSSAMYELQAVLTHKGRASNSGHYVAWVRAKGDAWFMFDDDDVAPVTSDDILKLSGGGDWHSAYVLLYGPHILEVPAE